MGVSDANRSAACNDRAIVNGSLFRAEHRATSKKCSDHHKDSYHRAIQADSSQARETTEERKDFEADRHEAASSTRAGLCYGL